MIRFLASCPLSYCVERPQLHKFKVQIARARFQGFRDEGDYANTVDSNMDILKYKIEMVRSKQRLETAYRSGIGWNYKPQYDDVRKRYALLFLIVELMRIIGSTIGFVICVGSLCMLLVSSIVHHA